MIKDNVKSVLKRVKQAAERVKREPDEIRIVCVTKGVDPYRINEATMNGVTDIGENRVQEALTKRADVFPGVKWHMVGHLQTNKVKDAVNIFDLIHSVDSAKLARKIDKEAGLIDKVQDVLIQVNTSGEEAKYGLSPGEIDNFLNEVSDLKNVRIIGLMTITPFLSEDAEKIRPYFKRLNEIFGEIKKKDMQPNVEMKYLSMGMSQDFEVAVEEGANIVRIGTAIFKEQP
jgi:PLP dependent protein